MSKVDKKSKGLGSTLHAYKSENIEIRGAREHNLKNVDLDIPIGSLSVITGLSGLRLLLIRSMRKDSVVMSNLCHHTRVSFWEL
jgi:hypothetical protein